MEDHRKFQAHVITCLIILTILLATAIISSRASMVQVTTPPILEQMDTKP